MEDVGGPVNGSRGRAGHCMLAFRLVKRHLGAGEEVKHVGTVGTLELIN
jgi:hypothetical protein